MDRETKFVVEIRPGVYYSISGSGCHSSSTSYLDRACHYDTEVEAQVIAKCYPESKVRKLEITYQIPEPDWVVVSYKESYSDYCRGCYMGTYSSKFQMRRFKDEDKAIDYIIALDRSLEQLDTEFLHWVLTEEEVFGEERPDDEEGVFYPMFNADIMYDSLPSDSHLPYGWEQKIKEKKDQIKRDEEKQKRDKEMPLFKDVTG